MIIKSLKIKNFRNIKYAEFDFHEKVNILVGNNAQGKTNLMEAISLCLGKSFRSTKAINFIPFDANENDNTKLVLKFCSDIYPDKENVIEYEIIKGNIKINFNKIPMKSAIELYGVLKYVIFIPEHLYLIKGNPEMRREYLDNVAFMQTKTHNIKLKNYNKALKQKNSLLMHSEQYEKDYLQAVLSPWNEILVQEGINVTYGRMKYFDFLKESADRLYGEITDGKEKLKIEYLSNVFQNENIDFTEKDKLYDIYSEELKRDIDTERRCGYTVSGIHRDDMNFYINEKSAKEFGSQGQVRSIALVLKLAEAEIIREKNKETPVIILDDVLSELDEGRRDFVIHHIVNSQIFITCCNINDVKKLTDGKMWIVEKGTFNVYSSGK